MRKINGLTAKQWEGVQIRPCKRCGMPINKVVKVKRGKGFYIKRYKEVYCDRLCQKSKSTKLHFGEMTTTAKGSEH